jgi:aryl-alcohol dehydrogenase-like predicted oxidoreductase
LKRDSLRREAESSLLRLGVDAIDLYQIHWPFPVEDVKEGWAALVELRDEGLVRHIGVSNFDVEQLRSIEGIAPVETLQPQYSLIRREVEHDVLPYAARKRIGVIVYSPMGSGLLTGEMTRTRVAKLPADDWRRDSPDFAEPRLSEHLAVANRLRVVARRNGVTAAAVAVAWTLANPAIDGAIVGLRSPKQVEPIVTGWSAPFDTQLDLL